MTLGEVVRHVSKRIVVLVSVWLVAAPLAHAETALGEIPLMDRPVVEIIAQYEAAGYAFLYSTGLVRPSLTDFYRIDKD